MRTSLDQQSQEMQLGKQHRLTCLGLMLVLALSACTTELRPPPPYTAAKEVYRVGPPDTLEVNVLPEPVIRRSITVRPDGMISVDLIGEVVAAGKTVEEIAADIEGRIGRFKRDASVTVSLNAARSPTVTIVGRGGAHTTFSLTKSTRVVEALTRGSGPNEYAAISRIHIVRATGSSVERIPVNLKAIMGGDLSTNVYLRSGDIVVIPRTRWAEVGYAARALFFPFQQIFGFGTRVVTRVATGNAF